MMAFAISVVFPVAFVSSMTLVVTSVVTVPNSVESSRDLGGLRGLCDGVRSLGIFPGRLRAV